jgi:hypothetical protein
MTPLLTPIFLKQSTVKFYSGIRERKQYKLMVIGIIVTKEASIGKNKKRGRHETGVDIFIGILVFVKRTSGPAWSGTAFKDAWA